MTRFGLRVMFMGITLGSGVEWILNEASTVRVMREDATQIRSQATQSTPRESKQLALN